MAGQATTQQDLDYYIRLQNEQRNRAGSGGGPSMQSPAYMSMMGKPVDYSGKINELRRKLQAETSAAATTPTAPEAQSQAAWDEAMDLLKRPGPYTPEVVNQLTNRRADQTAAAEAVNAEEIRNQAAARGMDPTQAIRGLQQGRQAQNVAFSSDIASQAAVQNFAAETPGRMAAAQANLGRQFGDQRTPAVQGGGGGGGGMRLPAPTFSPQRQTTAFSGNQSFAPMQAPTPQVAPRPQQPAMSVPDRNAAQAAWVASGGRTINGTVPGQKAPAQYGAFNTPIYKTPAQQNSLMNSLNRGTQYTPGVATKIPLAFAPKDNPFK